MTRSSRIAILGLCLAAAGRSLFALDQQGFSVSVLVDGRPAPEYCGRGRIYIEALRGKDFVIRLSNPTSGRIAVALSVDGRNVIDAKRTTEAAATKWILGPGQIADIPGWQVSGQVSRKFFFTETAKSYAKWLGDTSNVGTIEAVFFREKIRPPSPCMACKNEAGAMGNRETAQAPAAAPQPERRQKARETDSYAATGIGEQTAFPVQWAAFDEEATPAARIAIRYEFRPELVRLGVLPRADELFARDQHHGFEHSYAPDPYRQR